MPHKPLRPCLYPGCVHTVPKGYCEAHAHYYTPSVRPRDGRPFAAARGYDNNWQKIRAEVLRAHGIPRELWPLYDVHHSPEYDPVREPDHRAYQLTPLLHGEHSSETGRGRGRNSLQPPAFDRRGREKTCSCKMGTGG
jgi:hypothetical protein